MSEELRSLDSVVPETTQFPLEPTEEFEEDEAMLQGVDTLVVNALRREREHYSHQLLDDAVQLARRVGARRTYLIHACHDIGLQKDLDELLPPDIRMAYDGMVVKW